MRTADPRLPAARLEDRAAALCGCAALVYLAGRWLLTAAAGALLSARVPGASLANPAGTGLLAANLLGAAVSALALAVPFLCFWRVLPAPAWTRAARGERPGLARLFLLFWLLLAAGNLLAAPLGGAGGGMALPAGGAALAAAWLGVCLVPAVGEELLFRGLLQGWLRPFGFWPAVAGQAVLFALLHGRPAPALAALFGGLALGFCAGRWGSLAPGAAFHLYNNTLAFLGQYSQQYGGWQAAYYLLAFLPPLAALALAARGAPLGLRRALAALPGQAGAMARLLTRPGYLAPALALAALCLAGTFL